VHIFTTYFCSIHFNIVILCHHAQTSYEAHPASYPVDTEGSYPEVRAAGT
jgi:hypothetical protein